jgi:hemolysin III
MDIYLAAALLHDAWAAVGSCPSSPGSAGAVPQPGLPEVVPGWLAFREPVSACSHAAGVLLAVPATFLLLRHCAGERLKQVAFLTFGGALLLCYLGSTLYHGVRLPARGLKEFAALDHVGIHLLIAGTITPPALVVLRGRWRQGMLAWAWATAASGIVLRLRLGEFPLSLCTGVYVVMGGGGLVCYVQLARAVSHRAVRPVLWGGCCTPAVPF